MPSETRDFDIVLLGATGFTGGLIAEYLAANATSAVRVALAGRNRTKLEAVRKRTGVESEVVIVDATDAAALREPDRRSRVLVTTVGPYLVHGDPVVAACADTGTDYLDLTGEPEFVDLTYLKHHARAEATGARLIHACGFESVPHDLGAQFTVDQLPEGVPLRVRGYLRMHGTFSGGTVASALEVLSRMRQGRTTHDIRTEVEPEPEGRSVGHRHRQGRQGRVDRVVGHPAPHDRSARRGPVGPAASPLRTRLHLLATSWPTTSPLATGATIGGIGALAALAQVGPARRRPGAPAPVRQRPRRRPSATRPGSRSASSARAAA